MRQRQSFPEETDNRIHKQPPRLKSFHHDRFLLTIFRFDTEDDDDDDLFNDAREIIKIDKEVKDPANEILDFLKSRDVFWKQIN